MRLKVSRHFYHSETIDYSAAFPFSMSNPSCFVFQSSSLCMFAFGIALVMGLSDDQTVYYLNRNGDDVTNISCHSEIGLHATASITEQNLLRK